MGHMEHIIYCVQSICLKGSGTGQREGGTFTSRLIGRSLGGMIMVMAYEQCSEVISEFIHSLSIIAASFSLILNSSNAHTVSLVNTYYEMRIANVILFIPNSSSFTGNLCYVCNQVQHFILNFFCSTCFATYRVGHSL